MMVYVMVYRPCDPHRDEALWLSSAPQERVAAAILIDPDRRILLSRRQEHQSFAGLWEFPGGKIESLESPESALVRELNEELGVMTHTSCLWPLTFLSHRYDSMHLVMLCFQCRNWANAPRGKEGQTLRWVSVLDIDQYEMPEANQPLISVIKQQI